ncbi:STAS domain-containing protein [Actinoplanes utahensis]|uniref:STAS domain-containing protein n=1 Tax=Actinoplanes utahensis TaxID=1869 RepID=UPI00068DDB7F|nr:STAS domain-containing protein [Actinoplanes utahensis]GIF27306.1 hypothetical protein Aut01nite_02920 [Actinoplanes utahensis]
MPSELSTGSAGLSVDITLPTDSTAVVTFAGEIDRTNCVEVVRVVDEVLRCHGPRRVSLDMGEVRFIDSGGVRALVISQEEARRQGGDLEIGRAHLIVHQVLTITGLLEDFNLGPA